MIERSSHKPVLSVIFCLMAGAAAGDVLVFTSSGQLTAYQPSRHLVAFTPRDTAPQVESELTPTVPTPITPAPHVLSAIQQTALRYATTPTLRAAGLSTFEWLALFQANVEIESAYKPDALSHVGAIGLGQLMPDTALALGVDPHDMHQNLDGSARYLLTMLETFGTPELALAAYNAGPKAVSKHNGIPPYPETRSHVTKVLAVWDRLTKKETSP